MCGDTSEWLREWIFMGLLIVGFSSSCCFSSLVSAGIPEKKNGWGYHRGVVEYFLHVGSLQGWEPLCQKQVENTRFICSSSGAKAA